MSVTVPVSVAVSMSVTGSMAEFVSVSMSGIHDRFRFSVRVHVWAVVSDCQQSSPCLFPCSCSCQWLCRSMSVLVAMSVSVTVSESMSVAEIVFVTVSVTLSVRPLPCLFPLLFQSRPVSAFASVAGAATIYLNVSLSAWPRVRSPWMCLCMTMSGQCPCKCALPCS